ncbi:ABC transporter ATP-binding protein [Microvirga brassicacearum]|uniref:ABC transporter ATP-binding protein n=1 Tax=Microvirga brassicacearum TaxID=2580413 RepID=A0A5N3PEC2_9HYPH|nr:ABC transporter ATP-binding protein [Microvirga brassicacearum]KAB0268050.1 ABC transporter ATP-binding protein [Microvirga brassicacearum]
MTADNKSIVGQNLNLIYRRAGAEPVAALQDVSFTIEDGQFISLIGPSGCGKTTLLKIFGDLLVPTSGQLTINGEPPSVLRRRQAIGQMFQDATLLPWKTIGQNIALLGEIASRKPPPHEVAALANMVGIGRFIDNYPHELSGGMRQRAALARAYALKPRILLMDEPFGALDEITREHMNDELVRIWTKSRLTVIFVTHSIAEAAYLSDRVLVMAPRPGRVVAEISIDMPREQRPAERFGPELTRCAEEIHHHLVTNMQLGNENEPA